VDLLTWLVVGFIAGLLATYVLGGVGYGILGDIIVGILGAVVGGWLFGQLHITVPFGGLGGVIFVAFVGASALLLVLRAVRPRYSA
jgi:uncharacterized membrane protein YeaQ/YmgE (transglycosylase-associated protein family)